MSHNPAQGRVAVWAISESIEGSVVELTSIQELHGRALERFGELVEATSDDQWRAPTPCTEWDVRALVNHLVSENRWMPPLLAGRTIADVGSALDGDLLGGDPKAAWAESARQAAASVNEPGAMQRSVHVSFGDIPAEEYTEQVFSDLVIHGWDLARAIGADEGIDAGLLQATYELIEPMVEAIKASGAYGPEVVPPPGADLKIRLLAMTGRVA